VAYQVNQVACAMNDEIDAQMVDLSGLAGTLNIQKLVSPARLCFPGS